MMKNVKKIALSGIVILAFVFYALHEKKEGAEAVSKVSGSVQQNSSVPTETINPNSQQTAPTTSVGQQAQYKDGIYTSLVTDAYYGPLQIKVTVVAGKISDVQFLQYPNDRHTSVEINQQAMPILRQETISAQSANVDIVSGATQTSEAFQQAMREVVAKAS